MGSPDWTSPPEQIPPKLKIAGDERAQLIVLGGVSFVSALVKEKVIDEFVNPVAPGNGERIFGGLAASQRLKLVKSVAYNSGIVLPTPWGGPTMLSTFIPRPGSRTRSRF